MVVPLEAAIHRALEFRKTMGLGGDDLSSEPKKTRLCNGVHHVRTNRYMIKSTLKIARYWNPWWFVWFLQFLRIVSSDYAKPRVMYAVNI